MHARAPEGHQVALHPPLSSLRSQPTHPRGPLEVRRNTLYALMLLLAAIAVAGVLGVMKIYEAGF